MKNEIPVQRFDSGRIKNRHQVWKVVGLILLLCALQLYGTYGATFTTFYPSTVTEPGTFPTAINPWGVITGYYADASDGLFHGFVRARDGTITAPFDPPNSTGTSPTAINPAGAITGWYTVTDSFGNTITHGFLRASNGAFTSIDPESTTLTSDFTMPDFGFTAVANVASAKAFQVSVGGTVYISAIGFLNITAVDTGANQLTLQNNSGFQTVGFTAPSGSTVYGSISTQAYGINPAGVITGSYFDGNSFHGFLRTPGGSFTTFDPGPIPNPPLASITITFPQAINPAGEITGTYTDANGSHIFLRAQNGTITTFDPPVPPAPPGGTVTGPSFGQPYKNPLMGINPAGVFTGWYNVSVTDSMGNSTGFTHSFVRAGKTITTFDQGSQYTTASGINPAGVITGSYAGTDGFHGFLRTPDGTISPPFDPPNSTSTFPTAINPAGEITGNYSGTDSSGFQTSFGFLRIP
jgi:hypothetical protein